VIEESVAALVEGTPREFECAIDPGAATDAGCEVGLRVFIEVLAGRETILIVGAGHVGRAVAELSAYLGYSVVVVDERPELLTRDRFPNARDLRAGAPDEVLRGLAPGPGTFVVLVTPHRSRDELALAALAEMSVSYVGLMGGRRRTEATFGRARALDVPEEFLQQVHTPIGLAIGAETPREIAVSIVAQVIAARRRLPVSCTV
jgi:xanthine dehydrogenase accessory factor